MFITCCLGDKLNRVSEMAVEVLLWLRRLLLQTEKGALDFPIPLDLAWTLDGGRPPVPPLAL